MNVLRGPVEQTKNTQAPFGNVIYRTSVAMAYTSTQPIPICPNRRYRLRGWIRRTSKDETPCGIYWIGYQFLDAQNNNIQGIGTCYSYFVHGQQGSSLNYNTWRYFEFDVGPGGKKGIVAQARFLSLGCYVNYKEGAGTYQFCGFEVVQIF